VASIRKSVSINRPADAVWDALRDVGALHTRLVVGFVSDCKLKDGVRTVTFVNGMTVAERIVDVSDRDQRVVWSATGSLFTHHNASAQVRAVGNEACEVIWIADLLPDEVAPSVADLIEQGLGAMKRTMEARGK
jgi:carbon monoxide dehydrogenase subunit G